jgi:3-hydroxy-9,10-secoandrosta-1,3,5(10)-triene-9,17-dione monooxygenase reductase component
VIDPLLKRCLGQMAEGVQVVAAEHDGEVRAYTSHWVTQIFFEAPIVLASVSTRHDTWPLIEASGRFCVSLLAGDQVAEGQYFSYPGHRFGRLLDEYLAARSSAHGDTSWWAVPGAIAWLGCEVLGIQSSIPTGSGDLEIDHRLVFARVVEVGEGRLGEPALVYSSRQGWRVASERARAPGGSVRDVLLAEVDRRRAAGGTGASGAT